jgi:hypothetical protein
MHRASATILCEYERHEGAQHQCCASLAAKQIEWKLSERWGSSLRPEIALENPGSARKLSLNSYRSAELGAVAGNNEIIVGSELETNVTVSLKAEIALMTMGQAYRLCCNKQHA